MSNLKIKAFVFQLICFTIFFLLSKYAILNLIDLRGFWVSLMAFFIGTFLAPKFMATKTRDGEKLYMKWIFLKGLREIN